ncbi:MAG: hypothetical protein E7370_05525 [Clostridiales bacterium]|nr:hypothetical protein [Clostridiales bacterium]
MKNDENLTEENLENYNNIHLYIAIVACALTAVFFGLIFTPMGVYSLIVATVFALIALNFIKKHKKYKCNFTCKAVNSVAHILFGLCLLTFVLGIIAAALQG